MSLRLLFVFEQQCFWEDCGKYWEQHRHEASDKTRKNYQICDKAKDGHPFLKALFAAEIGKTKIKMYKPVCLGHAISWT